MPGADEFMALFDQYRIDKVDMKIFYSATNHNTVASTTNTIVMPVVNIVSDYDDDIVDSSWNPLEYPQCRTVQLGDLTARYVKHTIIRPAVRMNVATVTSPGGTPATASRSPWLDCGSSDVEHFGIKVRYAQFSPTEPDYSPNVIAGTCKFQFKVYFTLRNPR
jgi:hypothetical protein